jgi:hypothetical protein
MDRSDSNSYRMPHASARSLSGHNRICARWNDWFGFGRYDTQDIWHLRKGTKRRGIQPLANLQIPSQKMVNRRFLDSYWMIDFAPCRVSESRKAFRSSSAIQDASSL